VRAYLAGAMAGQPEGGFPRFRAAAAALRALGHEIASPVEMNEADGEAVALDPGHPRRGEFLRRDLGIILDPDTDSVIVLPGWEGSEGARLEVAVAWAIGKRVLAYPTLEPIPPDAEAESVLAEAERLVSGARASTYGHPHEHALRVAAMWSAAFGWPVTAAHVNPAMALFKLARFAESLRHRDSLVDVAGYCRAHEAVLARQGVRGFTDLGPRTD
jgi:hypothetical protein